PKEDLNIKAVDLSFDCAGRNADHSAVVFRLCVELIAICRNIEIILNITSKLFHPHIPHLLQSSAFKAAASCVLIWFVYAARSPKRGLSKYLGPTEYLVPDIPIPPGFCKEPGPKL